MMTNITNDDLGINRPVKSSATGKVSPVQATSNKQELPANGNTLPAGTVDAEQGSQVKQTDDSKKLNEAVRVLNEQVQSVQRELRFSVDEDSGQTVIKVIDLSTKEVIRQIPNEEALGVAKTLNEGADVKLFSSYT